MARNWGNLYILPIYREIHILAGKFIFWQIYREGIRDPNPPGPLYTGGIPWHGTGTLNESHDTGKTNYSIRVISLGIPESYVMGLWHMAWQRPMAWDKVHSRGGSSMAWHGMSRHVTLCRLTCHRKNKAGTKRARLQNIVF